MDVLSVVVGSAHLACAVVLSARPAPAVQDLLRNDGPAADGSAAQDRVAEGWRHLAAFFREGARHLPEAIAAFREAERAQRAAGGGEEFVNTLLGLSLALRLVRDPDDGRHAVVLAQEMVNIVRRHRGDAEALPYRATLEAAYRDLADVEERDAALRAAEQGIEACDRTLALARRLHEAAAVPASHATKAALLPPARNARGLVGGPRRGRDAQRLFAAALEGWPERDVEGGAAVLCDFAEALADARRGVPRGAVRARRGGGVAPTRNRYLLARARRAEAHAALAADRPDALDLITAAATEFRALGCEWDARQVEALV